MQAAAVREAGAPLESGLSRRGESVIASSPTLGVVKELLDAAKLPTSDLTEAHCRHFFYAGDSLKPDGIVGLEVRADAALLRSLVVRDAARGTGLGSALVAHAEEHARAQGARALYLLTTTAESFFAARGYAKAAREQAPPAIRTTREFAGICPASSAFMHKPL